MTASSLKEDSVDAIVEILDRTSDGSYNRTLDAPDRIAPIWEYDHNDRINYDKPAVYVWSPADGSISKFSIDGDNFLDDTTIEILIMTLDPKLTKDYQLDILQIIADYYDDNKALTDFYDIKPTGKADLRNEHVSGRTDHYIASVTLETNRFGEANT